MESNAIIKIEGLRHQYKGGRTALDNMSFHVAAGEIFGFLGPNGSGKTTLFRILATLFPLQAGTVTIDGLNLTAQQDEVRERLGIVFQSPSLDKKLTVQENLHHQGHLYGVQGSELKQRSTEMLERFGLTARAGETVENLSGGLQRRVEIAKSLLHRPKILLLDEPSTGLDPGARREMWQHLRALQAEYKVTILLTTHLMDEADQCDRLLVLDRGQKITVDTPAALKAQVHGTVVTVKTLDPVGLAEKIRSKLGVSGRVLDGAIRLEWLASVGHGSAAEWVGKLLQEFPDQTEAVTLSHPTLEDVFIQLTGRKFEVETEE